MRPKIIAGKIYHVLNRGVDKRPIFLEDKDYLRFIHDLYEFNDQNPINNGFYHFQTQSNVVGLRYIGANTTTNRRPRKFLVEILAFCLMKNHYHLMVIPKTDRALALFMKRLNQGYTRYFNEKNERSGVLFQGKYKAVEVNREAHFIHLPYYIHCNPLDYSAPNWRKREIKDYKKVFASLTNWRWSSFPDYIGQKNFPSVTQRDFLLKFFDGPEEYKKSMIAWLKDMDFDAIADIALE